MKLKIQNPFIKLAISFLVVFSACSKKTELAPDKSWVKIYNHSDFDLIFYPLDVVELADGRFIILSSVKNDSAIWPSPYLIGTDNTGNVSWKYDFEDSYINPIPNIISTSNGYYFICTDNNKFIYKVRINTDGAAPQITDISSESSVLSNHYSYPLYVSQTSDKKILLTSYNFIDFSTSFICFNESFSEIWGFEYSGQDDNREIVLDHLTRTGTYLSFFSGEIISNGSTYYYFNAITKSAISLKFINSSGSNTGNILGNILDRTISSFIQRSDNEYFLTRYTENQNFIATKPIINLNSLDYSTNIAGIDWPEIKAKAFVKNLKTTINGKEVVVIASTTRSNKIILMLFDPLTGDLKTSKYLGSTYPVNLASVIATKDGGLAILTQTDVAGSFPRIQLYKIPPENLTY